MQPSIAAQYKKIRAAKNPEAELQKHCFHGLTDAQIAAQQKSGNEFYRGKVRDILMGKQEMSVVHSDRLTAFDKFIGDVPYKGVILAAISDYWFAQAKKIMPTHYISRTDSRTLQVMKCTPFKVEVIVRGYLAGSMARAYKDGQRNFCGVSLDEGLVTNGKLRTPIITPTTKAAVFEHDENISAEEIVARNLCTAKEWAEICKMAFDLFALGTELNNERGWILVDTKYEFGKDRNGNIVVIDEIHTPDSSRFWLRSSYEQKFKAGQNPDMLDKEIVRKWLMEHGFKGEGIVPKVPVEVTLELGEVYLKVAEQLIGKEVSI